jgi:CheY-like chemotaxis protein
MLSDDFDVAGVATDGTQALETARQVHPDVIVLDVDMPGLDGFQTVRALEQGGLATTPIVFLSMHDADEIVSEAFRCGGRGYVLKTRVGRDLVNALHQALLGRVFVPSLGALLQLANGGVHAMQLHDGVESFLDGLAAFFDLALQRGDAPVSSPPGWFAWGSATAFGRVAGTSADRPGTNGIWRSTPPTRWTGSCGTGFPTRTGSRRSPQNSINTAGPSPKAPRPG